jgi:cytochrome c biogenesis protein CcmG/thiol:disulfide interchange protein DsbE
MNRGRISSALALTIGLALFLVAGCGQREEPPASEQAAEGTEMAEGAGTDEGAFPPPFTLPDLDGNQVSLSDFEGQVVVLDLWATWCPPCRVEIPFLESLHEELGPEGLVVLGVGLDQGGADVLAPFAADNGITYRVLVGDRAIQERYGVTGIPTTFLIGKDGRIAGKHVGYHPSMAEEMRAQVERLLRGEAEAEKA